MTDYCIDPTHSTLEAANSKLHGEILQYRSRLEEESKRAADAEAMEPAWMEQIADLQASLKKLCDERNILVLQNQELQKVVDAAVEWWADPHDTSKTIVDLQNAVEAYWENHKTEKPKHEHQRYEGFTGKVPICLMCGQLLPTTEKRNDAQQKEILCANCGKPFPGGKSFRCAECS